MDQSNGRSKATATKQSETKEALKKDSKASDDADGTDEMPSESRNPLGFGIFVPLRLNCTTPNLARLNMSATSNPRTTSGMKMVLVRR